MLRTNAVLVVLILAWGGCSDSDDQANNTTGNNNNDNAGMLCGNGQIEGAEECDDGAANSDSEPNACRTDCLEAHCGDGVPDDGEACDDGPQNADNVPDACRSDCTLPICGDGVVDVQQGESCDQAGDNSDEPNATCRTDCRIRHCGDGIWDSETEACDGAELPATATCADFGFYEGAPSCSDVCSIVPVGCVGECGDGVVQETEYCDGAGPAFEICQNYGYQAGHLGCSDYCTPGFDQCYRIGWQQLSMGGGSIENQFAAVWGTGNDLFIVVEDFIGGTISILHDDGMGAVTTPVTTSSLVTPQAIWGSAPDDVYVAGTYLDSSRLPTNGLVLHYDGTSWSESSQILSLAPAPLNDLWGSGPSDLWAVGESGTILHFDGSSWSAVAHGLGTTPTLHDLSGTAANDVWAVGTGGTIWHFDGAAWSAVAHGLGTMNLQAVWVSPTGRVYAAGAGSVMYHFDGSQWVTLSVPTGGPSVAALWGSSDDQIWAVAGSLVLLYNGRAWSLMSVTNSMTLRDVWGFENGHVYAVGGSDDVVLHYRGNAAFTVAAPSTGHYRLLDGLWGSDYDDVWAVGRTEIWHFDGLAWAAVSPGITLNSLRGVWGSAADDVFVAGQNQILRYNGTSWTQPWTGTATINDVHGTSSSHVVAVGSTILHYDGSLPWTQVALPSGVNTLNAVWAASDTDIFAVNTFGHIVHSAGNHAWTVMTAPDGWNYLTAIWGSAADNVFTVGSAGRVLHYDGVDWQVMYSSTGEDLQAVWGFAGDNVFAGGSQGTLIHWNGYEWTTVETGIAEHVNGIWGVPGEALFLAERYWDPSWADCTRLHRLLYTSTFF